MNAIIRIKVKNRKEAQAIRLGLDDKATRALVIVQGTLAQLPDDESRRRCLQCAQIVMARK